MAVSLPQLLAETTHYTYQDYSNNKAWEGIGTEPTPPSSPSVLMINPFIALDYNKVSISDDQHKSSFSFNDTIDFGYPYHLFNFKIMEEQITKISILWEGSSWSFISSEFGVETFIWNATNSNWEVLGNYSSSIDEDVNITISYTTQPDNYIDPDNNLYILVYAQYGDGDSNSDLFTDFVKVSVTEGETNSISGTVNDSNNHPIEGAIVIAYNTTTNTVGMATTSADGSYRIDDLPEGYYNIMVSKTGYETENRVNVQVNENEPIIEDFILETPPKEPTTDYWVFIIIILVLVIIIMFLIYSYRKFTKQK
ncbi:MAG: carboxypeptidase regulatory-like domain-containing protein [Thermoplasmata archaeon]|nr:MAG: carboxypeptidase regulatory-like domain-containing protein [Thermoplasmata archaeon]